MKNWIPTEAEVRMEEAHLPYWQAIIDRIDEPLADKIVLDFGCNRGGFLPLLYARHPFKEGVGVDIASEPIAIANQRRGSRPIRYEVTSTLSHLANQIDTAFSYKVIYLLPDLTLHAREIDTALKPGGSYYAATGCHPENPLWPEWRAYIQAQSSITVPNYSLEEMVGAFTEQGFKVSATFLMMERFIPITLNDGIFPTVQAALDCVTRHTVILCFTKAVVVEN